MSRIRANNFTDKAGTGAPTFPYGANVTGVVTATSFSGDGSALTGIDATALKDSGGNVKVQANTSGAVVTGVLTATSFSGDGSALTGIDATSLKDSGDTIRVQANTSGAVVTGIATVTDEIRLTSGGNAVEINQNGSIQIINRSTSVLEPLTVTAEHVVFSIARNSSTTLNDERARITYNGLTFNGDTAAANALDDYEEGTWTPDIDNAYLTTPGTTYNSRAGKYVKIGTMVLARFFMNIAGVTNSGVGPFFFGGLPFTHDTSDISHRGLQASLYISGPNTPTGAVNVNLGYAILDNGNYYLTLSTPIDDAASNNSRVIQASDISNGDVISGTIMYIST